MKCFQAYQQGMNLNDLLNDFWFIRIDRSLVNASGAVMSNRLFHADFSSEGKVGILGAESEPCDNRALIFFKVSEPTARLAAIKAEISSQSVGQKGGRVQLLKHDVEKVDNEQESDYKYNLIQHAVFSIDPGESIALIVTSAAKQRCDWLEEMEINDSFAQLHWVKEVIFQYDGHFVVIHERGRRPYTPN